MKGIYNLNRPTDPLRLNIEERDVNVTEHFLCVRS